MSLISVSEIAERINAEAATLAAELLPNGHRSQNKWMCSGISDHGGSSSMWVNLSGPKIGQWFDAGNCGSDEQKGDMIDLIRLRLFGGDKHRAIEEAKRRLGIVDSWSPKDARAPSPAERAAAAEASRARLEARQAEDARDRASRIHGAKALYFHDKAKPIAGTPAEAYLLGRGLSWGEAGRWPRTLKFHPDAWCKEAGVKVPAMLAQILLPGGDQVATHRTFLMQCARRGWTKLDVAKPKKVLGPSWGGFVPINKGASGKAMSAMEPEEPLYMAEGIEKCVAVRMKKPGARIVSASSLGNMGAIVLPEPAGGAARRLVIVADRDDKPDAQATLERVIAQQQARGVEVAIVMPPEPFKDIDEWMVALARQDRAEKRA